MRLECAGKACAGATLPRMKSAPSGILRIGTAGWSVPSRSAQYFPAEGSHLERYAAMLNAAEINSSFYKPHQAKT